jgi:hypothetical protein
MAVGPLLWSMSTMAEEWDAGREVSDGSAGASEGASWRMRARARRVIGVKFSVIRVGEGSPPWYRPGFLGCAYPPPPLAFTFWK